MGFLQTAERTSRSELSDNYVFARTYFAYLEAKKYIHGDVAELGSGEMYAVSEMATNAKRYICIDKHEPDASKTLPANAEFKKMQIPHLEEIPFNSYDVIICFQTIEHIKDDKKFCAEMHRILKPGGKLILTTPNKLMSLTRNPWHVREYTADTLKQLLALSFQKFNIQGVHGDSGVKEYYNKNLENVKKIKRFDIFNLENRLPAKLLQIPYDILNRMNRKKLVASTSTTFTTSNFSLTDDLATCLDFFVVAEK